MALLHHAKSIFFYFLKVPPRTEKDDDDIEAYVSPVLFSCVLMQPGGIITGTS